MGPSSEDESAKKKKPAPVRHEPETKDELIDEAGDESFPASDPPGMSGSTAGSPDHKKRD
jgi:hypothetical protein